jgi:hypothetical protein
VTASGRGFNLNTVAIIVGLVLTLCGIGKVLVTVTHSADMITGRLDGMDRSIAAVEGRLGRAEVAAAEAKAAAEAMTRETRYKEELDHNREIRQSQGSRRRER